MHFVVFVLAELTVSVDEHFGLERRYFAGMQQKMY